MNALDRVMTVAEVAALMDVSRRRVRQLCESSRLLARRVGRDWIIDRSSAESEARRERKPGRPK